ncbi:MAG TPA: hypothetical protein VGV89_10350 [Thermoplasmata archaeon]|nr:hypothetical protein [Thermoplasmata archaeon]
MNSSHHTTYLVLSGVLTVWGILLFFQSAYFGANFYGVPIPWWAAWVGQLPIWSFDVIDTIAAVVLIALLIIERPKSSARHLHRSSNGSVAPLFGRRLRRNSSGGAASTALAWILFFVFMAIVLYAVFGLNLAGLLTDLRGFLGLH